MRKYLWGFLVILILYSRFVGLDWGLPYPMHPDERNIVLAIQRLDCDIASTQLTIESLGNCFDPEFYAYGQPTIFAGYGLVLLWKGAASIVGSSITAVEGTMALRVISAIASVLNVFVLYLIYKRLLPQFQKGKSRALLKVSAVLFLAFAPYFMQFGRFGTTESLLMLLYSGIVWQALWLIDTKKISYRMLFSMFIVAGFAIAVKISSLVFIAIPFLALWYVVLTKRSMRKLVKLRKLVHFTLFGGIVIGGVFALFSPHTVLNINDFLGAMKYETDVGRGVYRAFYTRQFEFSLPYIFQMVKVFPYALGWPQYILAVLGFVFLSWKDARVNMLRIAIVAFFIPSAFLYAKWSRFLAPMFPLMSAMALLMVMKMYMSSYGKAKVLASAKLRYALLSILVLISIVPGVAYLRIYQTPDVRYEASNWIYENIPEGSYVLSETANVVDIPFGTKETLDYRPLYNVVSFDFYHVDEDLELQADFKDHIQNAEYIFVPSRRLFANSTCLKDTFDTRLVYSKERCDKLESMYPILNTYYESLFSGTLGYRHVATITSYPRIELFGYTLLEFPDEHAEETWTVFDHPVVRVYEKTESL